MAFRLCHDNRQTPSNRPQAESHLLALSLPRPDSRAEEGHLRRDQVAGGGAGYHSSGSGITKSAGMSKVSKIVPVASSVLK